MDLSSHNANPPGVFDGAAVPLSDMADTRIAESVAAIRRLVAGLSMPDWPEGARRAISISIGPIVGITAPVFAPLETVMERLREADGLAFETEGD